MKGEPEKLNFDGVIAEQYVSGENIVIEKDGKYIIIPATFRPSFDCPYVFNVKDIVKHVHERFECC